MARILITGFCAVPGPTRAGVQLRHVVRALGNAHMVDMLVVREGDQPYVERQGSGRLLRVPTHDADLGAQVQAFQRALRRQLEGADYDVVHVRDGWSGMPVLEGKERFGYAMVYDLTRAPMTERTLYEPELVAGLDRDEEACLLRADLILVPTEPARRYATSRGRPERVVLAPPGVDVDRFDWDEGTDDGGPPVILYAGPLAPGHGVRVLLRAMVDVVRETAARLVLTGPIAPGFDDTLRGGISELGLGSRVELRPPADHEHMPSLIASATVCVAPQAAELTPRPYALYPTKLLEYMACRRAVVAPRRGTVAMLIDHGREGLLYQPGDPVDLARKLRRLLEDTSLRDRLAQNGYERVRREFTASAARRAIKRAYGQLAAAPEWKARFVEPTTGSHDLEPASPGVAANLASEGGDDDFEATVYEAAPTAAGSEAGEPIESLDGALESSLSSLDAALATMDVDADSDSDRSVEQPFTEERSFRGRDDVTQEREIGGDGASTGDSDGDGDAGSGSARMLRRPRRRGVRPSPFDSGSWRIDSSAERTGDRAAAGERDRPKEPWIVVHTGRERTRDDDEGTPLDVVPAPPAPMEQQSFVAGEIDVPTPPPELIEEDGAFTAASRLLGPKDLIGLPGLLLAVFLQLATGLAFALAGRDRIRADGPFAPPAFLLVLIHVGLVTAPVTLYLYAAHADWSFLYAVDPADVPGLAIVPLVVGHALVIVGGWYLGSWLVRTDRLRILWYALGGTVAIFVIGFALAWPRLSTASTYKGYGAGAHGGLMSVELGWALLVSVAASASAAAYVLIEMMRDSRRVRSR